MALKPKQDGEDRPLRVLMVTSEYPAPGYLGGGAFVVRQIQALRDAGVEVDVLDFISRANPLNHFRAWQRLRKMMAEKQYDLIHAQFAISLLISRMQFKLPVVATYHGDEAYGIIRPDGTYSNKGHVLVLISQVMSFFVDELIIVSQAMGKRLLRKDYHIVPSGIDLDVFKPMPRDEARARLGWPTDRRIVLFAVLRVDEPRKRYHLAKAAVELAAQTLPVELRLASGIGPDEMPIYMNASDALVLTSLHEGSPTVVKEALACNLPVVTVNIGDVEERLEKVTNSVIVDPTPEAVARGIEQMVKEPVRSNGRETVQGLSEAVLAQKVIGIYRQAISKHRYR